MFTALIALAVGTLIGVSIAGFKLVSSLRSKAMTTARNVSEKLNAEAEQGAPKFTAPSSTVPFPQTAQAPSA